MPPPRHLQSVEVITREERGRAARMHFQLQGRQEITFHVLTFFLATRMIVDKDDGVYFVLTWENCQSAYHFRVFPEPLLEAIYERVLARSPPRNNIRAYVCYTSSRVVFSYTYTWFRAVMPSCPLFFPVTISTGSSCRVAITSLRKEFDCYTLGNLVFIC